MDNQLYIGLISGTSVDSIDAALIQHGEGGTQLLVTHSHPWPEEIQGQLLALSNPGPDEINRLGVLDIAVSELFAEAALALLDKANITSDKINAIGSHGQTIRHRPDSVPPFTLQIGDPNRIAEHTGITTVADFRRRDMAAGGEGAPLVPAFHNSIFRSREEERVVLNIGGIANLTTLPRTEDSPILGFDTGPGNGLMDRWIEREQNRPYDEQGDWAASGSIHAGLLNSLLADDYFQRPAPKSTGPEYFNLAWLNQYLTAFERISPEDVQATLSALTATSIANAIKATVPDCQRLLVAGGGVHNSHLIDQLREELGYPVESTEQYGLHPDWVEAAAFAWLAQQTLERKPGNVPAVTGARHPVILGGIYPA